MTTQPIYQKIVLRKPLKSLAFLKENMCFEVIETIVNTPKEILLGNKAGSYFKLLTKPYLTKQRVVVIYTNDCLNDYLRLKNIAIEFKQEPQYISEGLMIEFIDTCGNHFRLLEKRTYEDE